MLRDLPSLEKLVKHLQNIPYLASRNIYRVATRFLELDSRQVDQFCSAVLEAKKKINLCKICFNWCESNSLCSICLNSKRDQKFVCVVETWHDLFALEKAGGFAGVYHVLGGALCPLEGVGPDELTIDSLIKRVENSSINELVFATNPTPEGEATASYIASKLENKLLKISKLASGMPIGSSLNNMDRVTIYKALMGRRPF
jgi:recombination protein RecR